MSNKEKQKIAMLDTSFLIRLLKEDDPLHKSAKEYLQYLLGNNFILYVSTVAIAEYCVYGHLDELPFECVRVLPFNLDHAEEAGEFARALFEAKHKGVYKPENRSVIPNDVKLFAQASNIGALYFVTADINASKAMATIARVCSFKVEHLDIHNSISQSFNTLF